MINTRTALQTHLLGVVTASEVDWENDTFVAPDVSTPYYQAYLLRGKNTNLVIGDITTEGAGIFQVTLLFPKSKGTIPLETKAQAIIDHFKGQKLVQTDTKVKILSEPIFTMLTPTVDRFIGAVSIAYTTIKI